MMLVDDGLCIMLFSIIITNYSDIMLYNDNYANIQYIIIYHYCGIYSGFHYAG